MDENLIQQAAERCYRQFVTSRPDEKSFIGGFHVGAMWAFGVRDDFEPCPTCRGLGVIDESDPHREAPWTQERVCWRCKGDKGWPRSKPARAAGEG